MRVLITGATGFIGSNLLKNLLNDERIDNKDIFLLTSKPVEKFNCVLHSNYKVKVDDFLRVGFDRVDCVIHVGAYTPKAGSDCNLIKENTSNIFNTISLISNLPSIPSKFIYLSTLDVYGNAESPINEKTIPSPTGLYGWGKLYCEQMLAAWARQNSVCLSILRLGHIYGCGEEGYKKIIPQTIRSILEKKQPTMFTDGSETRSFLHVADCCRIIKEIALISEIPEILNLVSSQRSSVFEIVNILCGFSDVPIQPNYLENLQKGRDVYFDASKREKYFGKEGVSLFDGLREEFLYMKGLQNGV